MGGPGVVATSAPGGVVVAGEVVVVGRVVAWICATWLAICPTGLAICTWVVGRVASRLCA